ncbi:MAG: hypothetical protein ACJ72E_04985 [Marmoricola sp.]
MVRDAPHDDQALAGLRVGSPHLLDGDTVVDVTSKGSENKIVVKTESPHFIRDIEGDGAEVELSDFGAPHRTAPAG